MEQPATRARATKAAILAQSLPSCHIGNTLCMHRVGRTLPRVGRNFAGNRFDQAAATKQHRPQLVLQPGEQGGFAARQHPRNRPAITGSTGNARSSPSLPLDGAPARRTRMQRALPSAALDPTSIDCPRRTQALAWHVAMRAAASSITAVPSSLLAGTRRLVDWPSSARSTTARQAFSAGCGAERPGSHSNNPPKLRSSTNTEPAKTTTAMMNS